MSHWELVAIGFLIGASLGLCGGVFVAGLLAAAKKQMRGPSG